MNKTASPATLPAPGGVFTFNVAITNTGTVPVVITSIADNVYGNLGTRAGVNTCDDPVGTTVAAGGTVSCSFQGSFSGAAGATETDTVTVSGVDVAGNQASALATALRLP